jgi:hypothetical protein
VSAENVRRLWGVEPVAPYHFVADTLAELLYAVADWLIEEGLNGEHFTTDLHFSHYWNDGSDAPTFTATAYVGEGCLDDEPKNLNDPLAQRATQLFGSVTHYEAA